MRYEKIVKYYKNIEQLIKNKEYKRALKTIVVCSKAFYFYGTLPYTKRDIKKHVRIIKNEIPQKYKSSRYYYLLGIISHLLNRGEIATKYLLKAISKNNSVSKYYITLGIVYEKLKDSDNMIEAFDKAEKINQFNIDLLLIKGRVKEIDNDYDKALFYYNTAIDITPANAHPFFLKGRCLYLQDRYKDAVDELEKAFELVSNDDFLIVDLLTLLAEIYFELKQYKKSLEIFDVLLEEYPYRPEHYYAKSDILFTIGKESEALNMIDNAIDFSPENDTKSLYYFRKSLFLNMLSRTDEAIYYLEKLLRIDPNDVKTLDLYAEILIARSDYEEAIRVYKKRVSIEEYDFIDYMVADAYFSLSNYTQAYEHINSFINKVDDYAQAYILRAKINSIQGYKLLAISDLKKALKLNEDILFLYETDLFYLSNLEDMEEFQTILEGIEKGNEY